MELTDDDKVLHEVGLYPDARLLLLSEGAPVSRIVGSRDAYWRERLGALAKPAIDMKTAEQGVIVAEIKRICIFALNSRMKFNRGGDNFSLLCCAAQCPFRISWRRKILTSPVDGTQLTNHDCTQRFGWVAVAYVPLCGIFPCAGSSDTCCINERCGCGDP